MELNSMLIVLWGDYCLHSNELKGGFGYIIHKIIEITINIQQAVFGSGFFFLPIGSIECINEAYTIRCHTAHKLIFAIS